MYSLGGVAGQAEQPRMRKFTLLCLLCLTLACQAQEGTPTPEATETPAVVVTPTPEATETPFVEATPTPEVEAEEEHPAHAELRLLRQHMEDGMNAQDIDSVLEGVTDDVVFSTMNGDVVKGKAGIRSYFDKMMKGPDRRVKSVKTHFEVDELTILYSGSEDSTEPRFGVAYGHSNDEYTLADGTHIKVTPRWSAALVRDSQSWKIANFHYSVNMFDNPVLTTLKGTLAKVGGVGLVLGLLLGFLIGRRTRN